MHFKSDIPIQYMLTIFTDIKLEKPNFKESLYPNG
jgi:hypothetical protein